MRKLTCACETTFDADLPDLVDLDSDTGAIDAILNGSFMTAICPTCGTRLKPDLRVRLQSKRKAVDVFILPELERLTFYRGAIPVPKGCEVLIGFPELFERARVIADNLDPAVIEILKYQIDVKAAEESPNADIVVAYRGIDSGRLKFEIAGLREGEVAVLPVSLPTYERTLAEKARKLREDPFARIFKGPYRSVRALEADSEGQ